MRIRSTYGSNQSVSWIPPPERSQDGCWNWKRCGLLCCGRAIGELATEAAAAVDDESCPRAHCQQPPL